MRPCVAGVGEQGRVHGVKKEGPRADAALRPCDRPTVVGVDERHVAAGESVGREAAEKADGMPPEVDRAVVRGRTAEEERAPCRGVASGNACGDPYGRDMV